MEREQYSPLVPSELRPNPPDIPKNKLHSNKVLWIIIIILLMIIATLICGLNIVIRRTATAGPQAIQTAIVQTQAIWTLVPSQSPYPTQTPFPTQTKAIVTQVYVWTSTPDPNKYMCKPLLGMNYLDRSKIMIQLQAYVSSLSDVKSVSYVIPEKLYSNSESELFHVTFVSSNDGKVYSRRFIVYVREFGWKNAVFSIDGQCWIDPPN